MNKANPLGAVITVFRTKSQARGVGTQRTVTTRFHYDNLGRMTSKEYAGTVNGLTMPNVTYTYDAHSPAIAGLTSFAKGRRTRVAVTGGTATAVDSFDELGRATRTRQETGTLTYRFGTDVVAGYEYLRNGAVSVMRLPTGRVLTYSFDSVGRPKGVGDGAKQYVSDVTYTDHGAVGTLRMNGQKLRERRSYDVARLQVMRILPKPISVLQ